jgi:hypothetical protein
VSPEERAALRAITDIGLADAFRNFDQPEKSFSWWDYRQGAFRRNNGLRIDLILVHQQLLPSLATCRIDVEPRRAERASGPHPGHRHFPGLKHSGFTVSGHAVRLRHDTSVTRFTVDPGVGYIRWFFDYLLPRLAHLVSFRIFT